MAETRGGRGIAADANAAELVALLGHDSWQVREDAQARLAKMGAAALEEVRAACSSDDAEVSYRAGALMVIISKEIAAKRSEEIAKNLVWKSPAPAGVGSVAAVAEGKVFFYTFDNALHAVDLAGGKALWTFDDFTKSAPPAAGPGQPFVASEPSEAPLAAGGRIFATCPGEPLHALDANTGQAKWEALDANAGQWVASDGKRVLAADANGLLVAFEIDTGKEMWRGPALAAATCPVICADGGVFALDQQSHLACLDANGGLCVWSQPRDAVVQSLPTKDGRLVLLCASGITSIDAKTGKEVWKKPAAAPGWAGAPMAFGGGMVAKPTRQNQDRMTLCGDSIVYYADGAVQCLDSKDGQAKWSLPIGALSKRTSGGRFVVRGNVMFRGNVFVNGPGFGPGGVRTITPPCLHGGTVYYGDEQGLHAVDISTQQELWVFATPAAVVTRPVVVEGVILFGTAKAAPGMYVPGPSGAGLRASDDAAFYALRLP